jgi:hypothetical protein
MLRPHGHYMGQEHKTQMVRRLNESKPWTTIDKAPGDGSSEQGSCLRQVWGICRVSQHQTLAESPVSRITNALCVCITHSLEFCFVPEVGYSIDAPARSVPVSLHSHVVLMSPPVVSSSAVHPLTVQPNVAILSCIRKALHLTR